MNKLKLSIGSFIVLFTVTTTTALAAQTPVTHAQLRKQCFDVVKALDTVYYNAGTKLDLIRFDLAELKRQGKAVPEGIVQNLNALSKKMRTKWLAMASKRAALFDEVRHMPPATPNYIAFSIKG